MDFSDDAILAPNQLAITYCPANLRPFFSLVLTFDSRIKGVAARNTEPLIAQLRLAWWRDAISQGATNNTKSEPLLTQLSVLHDPKLAEIARHSMLDLLTAWENIIVAPDDANAANAYAMLRSKAVFGGYLSANDMRATDDIILLGQIWALQDIGLGWYQPHPYVKAVRSIRALTILAHAAQLHSHSRRVGIKLSWHALTGQW